MPHFPTRFFPSSCFLSFTPALEFTAKQFDRVSLGSFIHARTHHEGNGEDEGQREADDEGDDADHEERVRFAPLGVGGGRPEEGGVQDEGAVGHEQEARQDGDDQGGLLRLTTTV